MKVLHLVLLADRAAPHEVADELASVGAIEGATEAVQHLLDTLVADAMRCGQDLRLEHRLVRDENAAPMWNEAIGECPIHHSKAFGDLLTHGDDVWQSVSLNPELFEQIELQLGGRAGGRCSGILVMA